MEKARNLKLAAAVLALLAMTATACGSGSTSASISSNNDSTTTEAASSDSDSDSDSSDADDASESASVLVFDGESIPLENVICEFELNLGSGEDVAAFQGSATGTNAAGETVAVEGAAVDIDGATGNALNVDIGGTEWTGRVDTGNSSIIDNVVKTGDVAMTYGDGSATANLVVDCNG